MRKISTKHTLIAIAAMSCMSAFAGSTFYLTIPITARGTAPIADVSVNLANGTLATAMVGEPYSATVKNHLSVTGDQAFNFNRVGWGVSTGALPAGLNFDVTTGAITGTPTAPGANTFGITATYRGKADEGMFNLSVMEILLALQNNTLPAGVIGSPYNAGLQNFLTVTGDQAFNGSNVGWSFTSGALPAGLTLDAATGTITGTPTAPASAPFVVSATYRGKTASGTYSVSVLDITVNLASVTLPVATVDQAYTTNLRDHFSVTGDSSFDGSSSVTWALQSGALPSGLNFNALTGAITGTPGSIGSANLGIAATYRGKTATGSYALTVAGISGQQAYTTAGAFTWTVPQGVYSVSVVAVGGGNGAGSAAGSTGTSHFNNTLYAYGSSGRNGGKFAGADGGGFGGTGGAAGSWPSGGAVWANAGGGAGAGGYSGPGGNGGSAYSQADSSSSGGGGVGLMGEGSSGYGGFVTNKAGTNGSGGGGGGGAAGGLSAGSGGSGGESGIGTAAAGQLVPGGLYGGGSGGYFNSGNTSTASSGYGGGGLGYKNTIAVTPGAQIPVKVGAGGAVRIIWPGDLRKFPSTRTGDE